LKEFLTLSGSIRIFFNFINLHIQSLNFSLKTETSPTLFLIHARPVKTEWAFDYTGKIYPCTATVGKADESIGTFYPSITHKTEIINEWKDVT